MGRLFGWRRRWRLFLLDIRLLVAIAAGPLRRFGVGFPDALPQASQGVGTGLGTKPVIRAQSLHDRLDDLLLDPIGPGFPLPVIEHLGQSTNNGAVAVSVLMFETKEFA